MSGSNNDKVEDADSGFLLLDVRTCTPLELALHLQQGRFEGNAAKTQDFLQKAATAAAQQKLQQSPKPNDNVEDCDPTIILGKVLNNNNDAGDKSAVSLLSNVSCLIPRCGKVNLQLFEHGLQASKVTPTAGGSCGQVLWSLLSLAKKNTATMDKMMMTATTGTTTTTMNYILIIPKPDDIKQKKKQVSYIVLIPSGIEITYKSKTYSQLCFQLTTTTPLFKGKRQQEKQQQSPQQVNKDPLDQLESFLKTWMKVHRHDVGKPNDEVPDTNVVVVRVQASTAFTSHVDPQQSTTTAQLPFVSCYYGIRDGVLFPLREGLLFGSSSCSFWQFWPCHALHSIAAGRGSSAGGSSGGSRFVDLRVTLHDQNSSSSTLSELEFTNIGRHELGSLNKYIHHVLIPAVQQEVPRGKLQDDEAPVVMADVAALDGNVEVATAATTASEEDDKHSGRGRRCSKRKASIGACDAIRKRVSYEKGNIDKQEDDDDSNEEEDSDFQQEDDDDEDLGEDKENNVVDNEHIDDEVEDDDGDDEAVQAELGDDDTEDYEEPNSRCAIT